MLTYTQRIDESADLEASRESAAEIVQNAKREARNKQARERRRAFRDIADSLGMHIVRGSVSGRLYLE